MSREPLSSTVRPDSIVFVAPYPPFPLNGGAAIRRHRMLTGLAREFDVTFVTLSRHPGTNRPLMTREELRDLLPGMEVLTLTRSEPFARGTALARSRAILSRHSFELRPFMAPSLTRGVHEAARAHQAAIVHFDFHMVGEPVPVPGAVNVLSTHNVDHRVKRGNATYKRGRRRVWAELDWRKRRRETVKAWRAADLCLAVSDLDAAPMRAAGVRRVEVIANGTDPVDQLPLPRRRPDDPVRIIFVGSGRYPPYSRGIRWFINDVLPRVRRQVPAVFDVVGAPPLEPLDAAGVNYLGQVPELRPHYERAHVAVVPFFEGSGTRLKIPEALNLGRPVVSTSRGAEGQPVNPGRHYLQADDPDGFAAAIVEVARRCENPEHELQPMLASGRAAVAGVLWPQLIDRAVQLHREEIERTRSGPGSLSLRSEELVGSV